MTFWRVHFQDEAPSIGSGRRLVHLDRLGRQSVTIRDPYTLRCCRIRRAVWEDLHPEPAQPDIGKLKRAVKKRLAETDQRMTKAIGKMLDRPSRWRVDGSNQYRLFA